MLELWPKSTRYMLRLRQRQILWFLLSTQGLGKPSPVLYKREAGRRKDSEPTSKPKRRYIHHQSCDTIRDFVHFQKVTREAV